MLETTDGNEGWGDGGREDGGEEKKNDDDDGLLSPFPDLLEILSVPSKLSRSVNSRAELRTSACNLEKK